MPQVRQVGDGRTTIPALPPDATDRVAAIWRDGFDVWLTIGRRWYDRGSERTTWSPEDVVGDSTDLVEHLTPVAEASLELTIEMLRPWAQAFEERRR